MKTHQIRSNIGQCLLSEAQNFSQFSSYRRKTCTVFKDSSILAIQFFSFYPFHTVIPQVSYQSSLSRTGVYCSKRTADNMPATELNICYQSSCPTLKLRFYLLLCLFISMTFLHTTYYVHLYMYIRIVFFR